VAPHAGEDRWQGKLRAPSPHAGEIYFVASGTLQFKLEDEVLDVPAGSVVRIAPQVCRSVWNEGPDDAVLIMCSTKNESPEGDHETVADFWPE
jgi:mannose-6-phosphate isomerase-like protein (cupin superfamily)